ncbi:MAG TPA: hypothetical protein VIR00_17340, partial [Micromonosporaceae bacterium]
MLSVLTLVFALVGGAYLHQARQSEASDDAASAAAAFNVTNSRQFILQQAAQQAANAPLIAAQAKAKADAQHSAAVAAAAAAAAAH